MSNSIKGFKAFNNDMTCRGKQYRKNEIFEEDVTPKTCNKGMHFCEIPFDVLNYYSPDSEFAEVKSLGDISDDGNKISTNKLKIGAKIGIKGLIEAQIEYIHNSSKADSKPKSTTGYRAYAATTGYRAHAATTGNGAHAATTGNGAHAATTGYRAHAATTGNGAYAATTGNGAHAATTGNGAHAATTGNGAHAATTGYWAHAATTGYWAHAATTGYWAHAATTGDDAHATTTGYRAYAATTGYRAHAATTGDDAHATTTGDNSIAYSAGIYSRSKATKGWIIIVDWRRDNCKWYIHNIHSAKVGGKILDVEILPDTWYWFEDGILKIEESK